MPFLSSILLLFSPYFYYLKVVYKFISPLPSFRPLPGLCGHGHGIGAPPLRPKPVEVAGPARVPAHSRRPTWLTSPRLARWLPDGSAHSPSPPHWPVCSRVHLQPIVLHARVYADWLRLIARPLLSQLLCGSHPPPTLKRGVGGGVRLERSQDPAPLCSAGK